MTSTSGPFGFQKSKILLRKEGDNLTTEGCPKGNSLNMTATQNGKRRIQTRKNQSYNSTAFQKDIFYNKQGHREYVPKKGKRLMMKYLNRRRCIYEGVFSKPIILRES